MDQFTENGNGVGIVDSNGASESIKVLVRLRPYLSNDEYNEVDVVNILGDNSLGVNSLDGKRNFRCAFDSVLDSSSTQQHVYDIVRHCTESVLTGFNSTIFAYGQTGSGKTHTMFGPPGINGDRITQVKSEEMGIIPRVVSDIFKTFEKDNILHYSVCCSFVQIYNENLYDMLRDSAMSNPLTIREDQKEIYVQGLSEYNVKSVADTMQLLRMAEQHRAIRETNMNQFSSRSHSIFQIIVSQKTVSEDGGEISLRAKFNLVDLAGSEKWSSNGVMQDDHVSEMTNINLSLHTLGRCISLLANASNGTNNNNNNSSTRMNSSSSNRLKSASSNRDKSSKLSASGKLKGKDAVTHIPYRESKLTRLLQDSLGGNSRTLIIATLSPNKSSVEESISTLKFADRARQVMVTVELNESRPVDHALVQRLQREVAHLKGMLRKIAEQNHWHDRLPDAMGNHSANERGDFTHAVTSEEQFEIMKYLEEEDSRNKNRATTNPSYFNNDSNSNLSSMQAHRTSNKNFQEFNDNGTVYNPTTLVSSPYRQPNTFTTAMPTTSSTTAVNTSNVVEKELSVLKLRQQQLEDQNSKLWDLVEQLQVVSEKFFRYEVEEDDMRKHMQQAFASLQILRATNTISRDNNSNNNYNNQLQGRSDLNVALSTGNNIKNSSGLRPLSGQLKPKRENRRALPLPVSISSNERNERSQSQLSYNGQGLAAVSSGNIPKMPAISNSNIRASSHTILPAVVHPTTSTAYTHQQQQSGAYSSGQHLTAMPINTAYRVRGVGANPDTDEGWVSAETEQVDEEILLKEELKRAKRKLKKQRQLQEWNQQRELRNAEAIRKEEEEKKAFIDAEREKDRKRRARIRKQKLMLSGYYDKIKTETEQLKELNELGIDPVSLMEIGRADSDLS